MYDSIREEHSKVKKIHIESSADSIESKIEVLQDVLITIVELYFPTLSELAMKQVKRVTSRDALDLLLRMIVGCQDEKTVYHILKYSVAQTTK